MAISHEFEYFKANNIKEILDLLSKYGLKSRVLAGGTDLIVRIKDGFEFPETVIDIKGIQELSKIELKDNNLFVGSTVTFNDLINSKIVYLKFPLLWEAAKTVASGGIRNRATIIGNLCSAVPSLDSAPALLIYEAQVITRSKDGERIIPINEWFLAPRKTALREDEFVYGISIPVLSKKSGSAYVKLGRYNGEDLAQVGVGVMVLEDLEYRVAFCAVGPIPERARKIEALLKGKKVSDNLIEEVKKLIEVEISPITDIRATKEYRLHMAKVMLERGLKAAAIRLEGGEFPYGEKLI